MSIFTKVTELLKELAIETKRRPLANTSYVDFEPPSEWRKSDESETLLLYLPEFKKEQLKVQVSNLKTLNISGERHLDETKKSRFCKRVAVPGDCNANEIRAKFINGLLQIKMPKKNSFSQYMRDENSKISQKLGNVLPNSSNEEERATNKSDTPRNVTNIACTNYETQNPSRFRNLVKVSLRVVLVTVVVAGLGALIVIVYSCLSLLA